MFGGGLGSARAVLFDLGRLFQPKQSRNSKASPGKELWIQTRTGANHVDCPPMDTLVSHSDLRDRSICTKNPHPTSFQCQRESNPAGKALRETTPFQKEKRERRLKSSWTSPLSPHLILWALKCCPSALGGHCSFLIGRDRGY